MKLEDEYLDVLQNIEFAIARTYEAVPELSDYDVLRVFEAIKDSYIAEKIGRSPRHFSLSKSEQLLYGNVRAMCEWRLGRRNVPGGPPGSRDETLEPKSIDELLLCLKTLMKSVNKWNKHGGRRTYLDFISQFMP